jgi:acyl-lipid omega-6 desaturase (Delta-12 desaturase)
MPAEDKDAEHDGKKLLELTRPFAEESRIKSWLCLGSTLVILAALLVLAAVLPWWPLRLGASVLGGLVTVRTFILYHDFAHGSLLSGSRLAGVVFQSLGLLMLTPLRHWRFSHNFHHAHVGKIIVPEKGAFPVVTSDVGSFPLMSTESWERATTWQRLRYRMIRHPLTILCAYVTVFLFGGCLIPLVKNPRKYWDGVFSLLAHGGLIALVCLYAGFEIALFATVLPFAIASALGAFFTACRRRWRPSQSFNTRPLRRFVRATF